MQQDSTQIEARVQHLIEVVQYEFLEVIQLFICTEIERNNSTFLKEFGMHSKAAIFDFLAHKSRYLQGTFFCRKIRTNHTDIGMKIEVHTVEVVGHVSRK